MPFQTMQGQKDPAGKALGMLREEDMGNIGALHSDAASNSDGQLIRVCDTLYLHM